MNCLKCGEKIGKKDNFCNKCGEAIVASTPENEATEIAQSAIIETESITNRKNIIKKVYTWMSGIIIVASFSYQIYLAISVALITNAVIKSGASVHGSAEAYTIPWVSVIFSLILWFFATRLLKSANEKNSTFRYIVAYFLDLYPCIMASAWLPVLALRWIALIAYTVIFIYMISLSRKNKKEIKALKVVSDK